MSQMQFMRMVGPYFWGQLADRFGHRGRIIRLTSVMALLIFSAFFFFRRFEDMWLLMGLFSFFWVAALPLLETLTFDHLRENPACYSRVRLWGSMGFVVAVTGAGALLDSLQLADTLWMIAFTLFGVVLAGLALPERGSACPPENQLPMAEVLRRPAVKALLAACFFMSAAHGALYVFYSIFLSDHGYSPLVVGGLWSVGVLAEIAVFFFMSHLMRRFSLRQILLASLSLAVLRFLMVGLGTDFIWVLFLAQVFHALTFGAFHAASIAAINIWFSGRTRSRGQALYSSLSFGAGGLAGGVMSGWVWDHWGGQLAFVLSSLYALIGLLWLIRGVSEQSFAHDGPEGAVASLSLREADSQAEP